MKKKLVLVCTTVTLSMNLLCGCGSTSEVQQSASTEVVTEPLTSVEESTAVSEAPHEHTYTEEVTTPATCLEEGEKTFTCECGDTYTETIPATGHDFAEYVSNNDATYEADGTETATCSACGETDTRVAEGSMLTYTFEDMEATKYAKSTVNVRSLPTSDGEKLGGLSTNDEVKVTGKCNETGWYRIEYSGNVAYVSDSYLVDNKVETQTASASNSNASNNGSSKSSSLPTYATYDEVKAYAISLGYPIGGAIDNGDGTASSYAIQVIKDKIYWNSDYRDMYPTMGSDLNEARWAADDILGYTATKSKPKNIEIANCADENNVWVVFIEKWYE